MSPSVTRFTKSERELKDEPERRPSFLMQGKSLNESQIVLPQIMRNNIVVTGKQSGQFKKEHNDYITFALPMNLNNKKNEVSTHQVRRNYQKSLNTRQSMLRNFSKLKNLEIRQQNSEKPLSVFDEPTVKQSLHTINSQIFNQLRTEYINKQKVKHNNGYAIILFDGLIGCIITDYGKQKNQLFFRQGNNQFIQKLSQQYNIIIVFSREYKRNIVEQIKQLLLYIYKCDICAIYKVKKHCQYELDFYDFSLINSSFSIHSQNTIIVSAIKQEIDRKHSPLPLSTIQGVQINKKNNFGMFKIIGIEDMRLRENNCSVNLQYLSRMLVQYYEVMFSTEFNWNSTGMHTQNLKPFEKINRILNLGRITQVKQGVPTIDISCQSQKYQNTYNELMEDNQAISMSIKEYQLSKKQDKTTHEFTRDCECCKFKHIPKPKIEEMVKEVMVRKYELEGEQRQKVLIFPSFLYRPQKNILIESFEIKSKSKLFQFLTQK